MGAGVAGPAGVAALKGRRMPALYARPRTEATAAMTTRRLHFWPLASLTKAVSASPLNLEQRGLLDHHAHLVRGGPRLVVVHPLERLADLLKKPDLRSDDRTDV